MEPMGNSSENAGDAEERFVPEEPLSARGQAIALAILGCALGAGLLWHFYFSPLPSDLRRCDEIIREDLKAPATYRRVKGSDFHSEAGSYFLTYEAENSFGVPLRSRAICNINRHGPGGTWADLD